MSPGMFGAEVAAPPAVWPTPEMSSFSPSTVIRRDAADRLEIDRLAAMHHLALGQGVLHEHGLDGLEVELGRQVHDGEIFVVELAVLLGGVAVALDEVLEHVAMRRRGGGRCSSP